MNDNLDPLWVRASIFYTKESWHTLITNGILPFLYLENEFLESYYIHFCSDPIYNIRLTMKSKTTEVEELESRFLDYMDNYLLQNPSVSAIQGAYRFYPNNSVWLNQYNEKEFYLNNSLKFKVLRNIYNKPVVEETDQQVNLVDEGTRNSLHKIRQEISRAIDILAGDVIDSENIYTFIFYLQLGLIKSVYPVAVDGKSAMNELSDEMLKIGDTKVAGKDKIIRQMIRTNKKLLVSIVEEIWLDYYDEDLRWLENWITECAGFINKANFDSHFTLISKIIYEHMGLSSKKLLPLSLHLIRSTFENINYISI